MNEMLNKFFLTGDKLIPGIYLLMFTRIYMPGFSYSACGLFIKSKQRIKNFWEAGDSRNFYQNELDKACVQHGRAYVDFKDLPRRAASDKVFLEKAFNITKNPK